MISDVHAAAFRGIALRLAAVLLVPALAASALAQDAVTISGHVTAASFPVRGANVGIADLGLSASTDANGRYSFIVPSARVRGQRVTLTARYLRYRPQSVEIVLVGGTLVQDFDMQSAAAAPAPVSAESRPNPTTQEPANPTAPPLAPTLPLGRFVDSTAFEELPATADLGSALAGRVPGLQVTSASTAGGSSALTFRGPHSIAGPLAPLFVVDGFPVDNSNLDSRSQQLGLGGFDYGTAIRDLNLGDIASVTVLDPAAAALLYGGRAANGVILVTTKSGRGLHGFEVAASQQVTTGSPLRLPVYQNSYGQGLNGQFEFLDGSGGGLNDGAAESWGPPLAGQPVAQASLTAARTGDVRFWLPQPDNVSGYFAAGRTYTTNVSAQSGSDRGNLRLSASSQSVSGLTPSSSSLRQTVAVNAGRSFTSRFSATATGQFVNDGESTLPGTGFDAGNAVSDFSMLGRQVDVQALKNHLSDSLGNQINWIYTNHDNPYVLALDGSNENRRTRVLGGLSATYAFSPALSATVRSGADSYHETRDFTIAPGWMGGFPVYQGNGSFATGGFQNQGISVNETNSELFFQGHPTGQGALPLTVTAGVSHRTNGLRQTTVGQDFVPLPTDTVAADLVPVPERLISNTHTDAVFAGAHLGAGEYASLDGALRGERLTAAAGATSNLYPSLAGTFDVGRAFASLQSIHLGSARLRASWSQTGNQVTPAALQAAYFGLDSAGFPARTPAAVAAQLISPELTNAWEIGAGARSGGGRLGLDVAYYDERSSNLLLPVPGAINAGAPALATGAVSNHGLEAQLDLVPVRTASGLEWNVVFNYDRNRSQVDALSTGTTSLQLGPSLWGLTVEARDGQPLPALVGNGFLRDSATGQLLLQAGHPLPDVPANRHVLGVAEPNWTGSVANSFRFRGVELSFLIDAHVGGSVFSASNMWGSVSGNLQQTAFRPDSGLLISGIDIATGKQNTQHVSTQDYYHSLLAIQEPWVYDASFIKLREARLSFVLPLHSLGMFTAQSLRASLIGRNLYLAARAPNIDPETALGGTTFQGAELGQLPTVRSVGVQISIVP